MIGTMFSRLSTSMKMLIVLSAALLPLGLIAVFASIESAKANRLTREAEVRLVAAEGARRIGVTIVDLAARMRRTVAEAPRLAGCGHALDAIAAGRPYRFELALFDGQGRRLCATHGFSGLPAIRPATGIGTEVRAVDGPELLRFSVAGLPDGVLAVGELPARTVAGLLRVPDDRNGLGARLREGDAVIDLSRPATAAGPFGRALSVSAPVANGQLSLELVSPPTRIRAIELLMILLPILMWLAAAVIGWLVMDRLVLRPLAQLQRAIAAAGPDAADGVFRLPALTTPSAEIRALAAAFAEVTRTISAHEAELQSGLARQTKLTREVHHRVKNNLQVVSSLINLHSRGVEDRDVAAAYGSIQRRVDALAVVHRNHYAELEENRGVDMRSLMGELASNLRATAPADAARMAIMLDLVPAHVSQDVAVPVAFLVTELVEVAMTCAPDGRVVIGLMRTARSDRAALTVEASGLADAAKNGHPSWERSSRVMEGLARQLRSPLVRDEAAGCYAIEISITPPATPST